MPLSMLFEPRPRPLARERKDFDLRVIVWSAVITTLVAIGVHVGLRYLELDFYRQAARQDLAQPSRASLRGAPPGPALRPAPIRDLNHFRREQEASLEGYAWADDKHERVRIPITRAMELLAERGLAPPKKAEKPASTEESPESNTPEKETPCP